MQEIVEKLRASGYEVASIEPDGLPHRFGPGRKNHWYICFKNFTKSGEEFYFIVFGDWEGVLCKGTHCTLSSLRVTTEDRAVMMKQILEAKRKNEKERKRSQQSVTLEVQAKWEALSHTGKSSYLERKRVQGYECRYDGDDLYIPIRDEKGALWSLQKIQGNGRKFFHPGGRVKDCFHVIAGTGDFIYICEGYATGATIHMATGCTVVVAFNSGNLGSVAKIWSKKEVTIIIAGDDDANTDNNPGRSAAENAAKAISAGVVFPKFRDRDGSSTDFNDIHCREGIEEVALQLRGAGIKVEKPSSNKMPEESVEELGKEILDCRFKIIRNEETTVLFNIKDIEKKELKICLNEEYLMSRLRQNIIEKRSFTPTDKFLAKVYSAWKLSTTPIKDPLSFAWKSQDEWTFKKLDFEPCTGSFDAWTEFLVRLSAPEDFMAFVWSIFELKNKSRQYLYLFDPNGQGGKSTVINVLGEVFGNSYAAINNTFVNNGASRWLMGNLYGKRLVGWPDCKNTKFCMTELLRNITSGDDVTVEFKGKQPFTARMYVKFIMASNHEPSITGGGADLSRLIRLDVAENKNSKNDPHWKKNLRKELPYFLFACREWYLKKCESHGNIELSHGTHELANDSTMEVESKYEAIAEKHLVFGDEYTESIVNWTELCSDYRLNCLEVGNFKDYLCQGHRCVFKRAVVDGKKVTKCIGFKVFRNGKLRAAPQ